MAKRMPQTIPAIVRAAFERAFTPTLEEPKPAPKARKPKAVKRSGKKVDLESKGSCTATSPMGGCILKEGHKGAHYTGTGYWKVSAFK